MVPAERGSSIRICEELVSNVLGAGLSPGEEKLAGLGCHCSGFPAAQLLHQASRAQGQHQVH